VYTSAIHPAKTPICRGNTPASRTGSEWKKAERTTGGHNNCSNGNSDSRSSDTKCCDGIVLMHLEQQQQQKQKTENSIKRSLRMRAQDPATMPDGNGHPSIRGVYALCATLRIRTTAAAAAGTPMAPRSP